MAEQLPPWRDVIAPHPDVQSGRYLDAEFAADLAQVLAGKASAEYGDPAEFFRRTYLTDGMRRLLLATIARLGGKGGEPVIQLKTAFGGGKTHTMLALYHLLSAPESCAELSTIADLLRGVDLKLPPARVAVLVGTALDPQRPSRVLPEGTEVNTLWGEMAYQLGGSAGFELVAQADYAGTAPGSNTLVELFTLAGPSLILIDELVAYIRNIKDARGTPRSGSFNANLTFVQNLTEAVRRSPQALLVASIPESRIEYGDASGEETAHRIENTFGRLEVVWQPVAARESFEVVRRRLFGDLTDPQARDRTVEAFGQLYRQNNTDFPNGCREASYEQEIRASYPIHPEFFARLYDDWSVNIDRFQRTRGVLRLMAGVISILWERNDHSPLIMPGSLPLDHPHVRHELTRYLGDAWNAVVDSDIDGDYAASVAIDREVPRMGQIQACRRIARTIFLGSVPGKSQRGIDDNFVKLGTVQPGEQIAVYADALARMRETLTYLYGSGLGRCWFAVQPNLNRTVADRASKFDDRDLWAELEKRMRQWPTNTDVEFTGVHIAPKGPDDIPDDDRARLVVLPPAVGHKRASEESQAIAMARSLLESRGVSPRSFRNMLLFLAADADALTSLLGETRRLLAWRSVREDALALNLDEAQRKQCDQTIQSGENAVAQQLEYAYLWLLAPRQEGTAPVIWEEARLTSSGEIGAAGNVLQRASYRATSDEHLIKRLSPVLLKMELDRYHLWPEDASHVGSLQLWQYFATYPYLPRLKNRDVLLDCIRNGAASSDYFGYATSVSSQGKYQGLFFGRQPASAYIDEASVIVKPEVAREALAQQAAEEAERKGQRATPNISATNDPTALQPTASPMKNGTHEGQANYVNGGIQGQATQNSAAIAALTTFFGSVDLDALRLSSSAGQVSNEIVQHLAALLGADVKVRLEIEAHVPGGVPEQVLRTIIENARTLKFRTAEFSE